MSNENPNQESSPLKLLVRATLDILDKNTGRQERKVLENGILIEHKIINEGVEAR